MADFETVIYEVDGHVATIKLNRPEARNSFNTQLRLDLGKAIGNANEDANVRVVVLAGEGKGFCAGHDLGDGMGGYDRISQTIEAQYRPFLDGVSQSDKIYIAAINGAAAGIGGALAMACDLAVMGESAFIYQAFLPVALVPDGGACWHLVRTLGYKRTMQLILDAEKLPAAQCVDLGLANKVVADDQILAEAQAWAQKLSEGAPLAQRFTKRLVQQAMDVELDTTIREEALAQDTCSTSKDAEVAITAFFNKTKPVFTGS